MPPFHVSQQRSPICVRSKHIEHVISGGKLHVLRSEQFKLLPNKWLPKQCRPIITFHDVFHMLQRLHKHFRVLLQAQQDLLHDRRASL